MRDYDSTTGRYIQADPLGLIDGASVYGYALQSPYKYIDPTGLAIRPIMPMVPGGWGAWDPNYGCGNDVPEPVKFKELCTGAWLFVCSMLYGVDGDSSTNTRAG